jgi:hypothetical protein
MAIGGHVPLWIGKRDDEWEVARCCRCTWSPLVCVPAAHVVPLTVAKTREMTSTVKSIRQRTNTTVWLQGIGDEQHLQTVCVSCVLCVGGSYCWREKNCIGVRRRRPSFKTPDPTILLLFARLWPSPFFVCCLLLETPLSSYILRLGCTPKGKKKKERRAERETRGTTTTAVCVCVCVCVGSTQ